MKFRVVLVGAALCALSHLCGATVSVGSGNSLPSGCTPPALFFLTSAKPGQNLYGCVAQNEWASEGVGTTIVTQQPPPPPPSTIAVKWGTPPSSIAVPAKQSTTIAFDRTATWALQPGSRGSIRTSGNTVTYSAPSVSAPDAVAGCQVLPADTVYMTPISALPVNTNSAAWIAQSLSIGSVGISFGESWGHNLVTNATVPTAMTFLYSTGLNGSLYPLLTGNNRNREGGAITTDGGMDHHMVTINYQTCHTYETYHDYLFGTGAASQYTANSGYDYTSSTYTQPIYGTTDAAGLPLMPLTVHMSEWESGIINHALRFTSCAGCIGPNYLWPASGTTASVAGAAPMGSRWRLKSSFPISTFSAPAQVILTALQNYGMFLADIGGIDQIQVDDDINQDSSLNAALGEIQQAGINQSDFDIVDESSLMISATSSRVDPGNAYVKPANYVQLNGVDTGGNKLSIPIAIQPVLVGTPNEVLQIQAGSTYQIPVWVNNAANQAVTWAVTAGPGTISSSGVYTAPASVGGATPVVITATAVADPSATLQVRGNVIPSGAIRLDVGGPTPYTDSLGNIWLADNIAYYGGSYNNDNETYPAQRWGGLTDWFLYGWEKYTWGDDIVYGPFVVPNGSYNVTFMMASPCAGTLNDTAVFDGGLISGGNYGLEVNGAMTLVNFAQLVKDACVTPGNTMLPVTVTNNLLTVAVRATGGDQAHTAPFLNALQIVPAGSVVAQ